MSTELDVIKKLSVSNLSVLESYSNENYTTGATGLAMYVTTASGVAGTWALVCKDGRFDTFKLA